VKNKKRLSSGGGVFAWAAIMFTRVSYNLLTCREALFLRTLFGVGVSEACSGSSKLAIVIHPYQVFMTIFFECYRMGFL